MTKGKAALVEILSYIRPLQCKNILPAGEYEYFFSEQLFSYILRVHINGNIFFFKRPKLNTDSSILKLEAQLVREHDALVRYHKILSVNKHFHVPKPIYLSVEDLIIVTEGLKGEPILDMARSFASRSLRKSDNICLDTYSMVGEVLKILHQSETQPYTIQDLHLLVEYIRHRLLSGIFGKQAEKRISDYLRNAQSTMRCEAGRYFKSPVHHDFGPQNILSCGEDINVLDFADFKIDHKFQDLVYFRLMVERQLENRIKYRASAVRDLIKAFSDGYGCNYEEMMRDKLYKFYVLKNMSIFIRTLGNWKNSSGSIKNRTLSYLEYNKMKRSVLDIIRD